MYSVHVGFGKMDNLFWAPAGAKLDPIYKKVFIKNVNEK